MVILNLLQSIMPERMIPMYDTCLLDNLRIVLKCLVSSCHLNQLNCFDTLAFHMNPVLLQLDPKMVMTDHYPTNQEMRKMNLAVQRGQQLVLALGQET